MQIDNIYYGSILPKEVKQWRIFFIISGKTDRVYVLRNKSGEKTIKEWKKICKFGFWIISIDLKSDLIWWSSAVVCSSTGGQIYCILRFQKLVSNLNSDSDGWILKTGTRSSNLNRNTDEEGLKANRELGWLAFNAYPYYYYGDYYT